MPRRPFTWRSARCSIFLLSLGRRGGGLTPVGDEGESAVVAFGRRMLLARGLAPDVGIDRGKVRVAGDAAMDPGDDEARREGQRLGVDLGAASDDDRVRLPAQGVTVGGGNGGVE